MPDAPRERAAAGGSGNRARAQEKISEGAPARGEGFDPRGPLDATESPASSLLPRGVLKAGFASMDPVERRPRAVGRSSGAVPWKNLRGCRGTIARQGILGERLRLRRVISQLRVALRRALRL